MRVRASGMQIPGDASRLRIHIGANDTFEGRPLVDAIIAGAREFGLAGATVRRGISGFGDSSQIHQVELVLSHDLPVVIDITDEPDKIDAFLPIVQQLIGTGLVTRDTVTVLRYGAATKTQESAC